MKFLPFSGKSSKRSQVSEIRSHSSIRQEIEEHIEKNALVVFGNRNDSWTQMMMHALRNILLDERVVSYQELSGEDLQGLLKQRELIELTGQNDPPYVFLARESMGSALLVVQMIQSGSFTALLRKSEINVKPNFKEVSVAKNIYNYPKGDLGGMQKWGREGTVDTSRLNVLVVACGSTASDKVPKLVGMLKKEGFGVKLAASKSGEHFFKDHGMGELLSHIDVSDIYRDDDEWAFRYQEFGMPVRALHLALCDWADIAVVAPASCNTMGRVAHGCADNLVSCICLAWQYQEKPVLFCPACNANMWNNISTRNSVAILKEMGVRFVGPAEGMLSSGRKGYGMLAPLDEILQSVKEAAKALENPVRWYLNMAKEAFNHRDINLWPIVIRFIDEGTVKINDTDSNHFGDSVLHIALGGELENDAGSEVRKAKISTDVVEKLIKLKADVNLKNQFNVSPLDVAVGNRHIPSCSLLLDARADPSKSYKLLESTHDGGTEELRALLKSHINHTFASKKNEPSEIPSANVHSGEDLCFIYGDYKEGFPRHDAGLFNFLLGMGITVQAFPLLVPKEPSCDDPACQCMHRHPTLLDRQGMGFNVKGEIYLCKKDTIKHLDVSLGYYGKEHPDNRHTRRLISLRLEGGKKVSAHCYFLCGAADKMKELQEGKSECRDEYTLQMSQGRAKTGSKIKAEVLSGGGLNASVKKQRMASFGSIECQQAINCSNLTCLEYAFRLLEKDITVNDIFHAAELPVGWVVDKGLCLAQLTSVATEVIAKLEDVWIESYHFDADQVNYSGFESAILSYASRPSQEEVVICNCAMRIAHDSQKGGGHFALLGYIEENSFGELVAMMYEVQPDEYGRTWSCPLSLLFKALQDKDGDPDVKRARGIIRLGRHRNRGNIRDGWARMSGANTYVCHCDPAFDDETRSWLATWGSLPADSFEAATNIGGVAVAALALTGMTGKVTDPDEIVRVLDLDYTKILNQVLDADHTSGLINKYVREIESDLEEAKFDSVFAKTIDLGQDAQEFLSTLLLSMTHDSHRSVVMLLLDVNLAKSSSIVVADANSEANVLSHGAAHWAIAVEVDVDHDTIIFADPKSKMLQRLWRGNASDVWLGLQAMGSSVGVHLKQKTTHAKGSCARRGSTRSNGNMSALNTLQAKTKSSALLTGKYATG
eukprot:TRINITY_DN455_c0_g2_i4.p1 TRINITY_DN455_c0_g2~~TRINITY_DN455_c0_g2_i4.p1  ORF type:complete len:1168 (-),score=209.87 TRINITY_DN455_c0_g2_i4:83-3586(-)